MKMRKTKTKFMSLLLAVMMIVGMLPTTVFAAGEITTGNAKVTAPVAGQTPSFTATSDEPEKYSVKLLKWIDREKNMEIKQSELTDPTSYYYNYTFKGGVEYTAIVEFIAVGGNTLSYSNSFTINGETTYWSGNGLKRCYTFTATGTGGGEGTEVYSATVADINITLPAGYTSNDIDDLGQDRTIKVTNTGTETLYISNPTLSGTNASDFSVRVFGKCVVVPGNTNTTAYAIEPKIGLAPGTYTATISCTDDNNKLSAPVTAKVTLTVSDHNWDTSKWEFNSLTHWHKCTDSGCSAKGDEAAHNSDKVVGAESATFDTDGYTGDKYCSICDRKMETGKAIAAGKYIRESKATMTPAGIDNTISANDLVFTSLDTSKYTVGLYRVFDMTDTTLNTVGMGYPHDKKFISGHKYAIEFEFEAVAPYVYDTMHGTHSSTFKLNDADTMMSAATTHAGSPARRVELVAGGVSVATYDLTTSVNGGHGTISAGENGITEGTSKIITFTPDSGYEIDKVMVNGTETTVTGNTLTVTMDGNKNVVVTYKAIEYTITVTAGKATIGAGSEISKAAEGTAVTLTANAAPSGKVFDKWVVESGSVALADSNSATTTFTMPASAVSVKATYKNAPHTHTYNQETVKPEALKTPAGCTNNAVYFKSCSCGAISTTDTFVAMNTALGHAYGSDWKYDSTNHWHECSRCHDKKDEAAHTASDWIIDTPATATTAGTKHKECTVCHRVLETQTIPSTGTIEYNITVTDGKATIGAGSEITKATAGTIVTLTANAAPSGKVFDKWEVVSGGITLADVNSATTTFTMPASAVSVKATYKNAPHTPTPTPTPTHTHNLTLVAAKAATFTEDGKEAYYKCEGCDKFYEDVLGTKEITDLASWGNIAKIAHTTKQTVTKASSIKLKATSLTYNGKVRTPKVIVKDRTGKTLVKNTDYTVSYAKGRKYVGKYAVKITFKGKYSGTKTLYFTIKPKATSISSLKAGSKKFTVKWKKQATQTTGYQVQYSASSKFSKAKTVTVGKNTTVSKKISKLSGKKKYYVRVRTYKTVKINGKSIRIYSGWSKAKTVTTKK